MRQRTHVIARARQTGAVVVGLPSNEGGANEVREDARAAVRVRRYRRRTPSRDQRQTRPGSAQSAADLVMVASMPCTSRFRTDLAANAAVSLRLACRTIRAERPLWTPVRSTPISRCSSGAEPHRRLRPRDSMKRRRARARPRLGARRGIVLVGSQLAGWMFWLTRKAFCGS
jgi:hypothetical protein